MCEYQWNGINEWMSVGMRLGYVSDINKKINEWENDNEDGGVWQ